MKSITPAGGQHSRPHRQRGLWVPADEAPYYLAQGWRIIDDGGDSGELLLAPPEHFGEAA